MRYRMLGRLDETKPDAFSPPPEMFAAVQKLGEEMKAAGALVETHGLLPSSTASRVRSEQGTRSVRTGPFDEGIGAISNYATSKRPRRRRRTTGPPSSPAAPGRRSRSGS